MIKFVIIIGLAGTAIRAQVVIVGPPSATVQTSSQVVEWHRNLLGPVCTREARATVSREEAVAGLSWSEGAQNYWNEIIQTAPAAHKPATAQTDP